MLQPKRIFRGLPSLGRALDARQRMAGMLRGDGQPLPLGLPPGTGRAALSTLRGGSTPGGGGAPGGGAAGEPGAPAYPEEFGPPAGGWLFQSSAAGALLANSTSETSLAPAGRGSLLLPAGLFVAGRGLGLRLAGSCDGDLMSAGNHLTLRVYLGAAAQFSVTWATGIFGHSGVWSALLRLVCRTAGPAAAFHGQGELLAQLPYALAPASPACTAYRWHFAGASLDTAAALALDVTAQHSEALAGNSVQLDDLGAWRIF